MHTSINGSNLFAVAFRRIPVIFAPLKPTAVEPLAPRRVLLCSLIRFISVSRCANHSLPLPAKSADTCERRDATSISDQTIFQNKSIIFPTRVKERSESRNKSRRLSRNFLSRCFHEGTSFGRKYLLFSVMRSTRKAEQGSLVERTERREKEGTKGERKRTKKGKRLY